MFLITAQTGYHRHCWIFNMCLALCISSLILPNPQEVDTVALPPLQMKVTLQMSRLKEVTEATTILLSEGHKVCQ